MPTEEQIKAYRDMVIRHTAQQNDPNEHDNHDELCSFAPITDGLAMLQLMEHISCLSVLIGNAFSHCGKHDMIWRDSDGIVIYHIDWSSGMMKAKAYLDPNTPAHKEIADRMAPYTRRSTGVH